MDKLTAGDRRRQMAMQAGVLLAARGFGVSTRDIAAHLGVSQALIYKYFANKDALIETALQDAFSGAGYPAMQPGPI